MKNMAKILVFIVAIALAFSLIGVNAFAADATAVAKIGDVEYGTLQSAIDAAVDGDVIVLAQDCAENVTVAQAPDVKLTIDGSGYTLNGTITVDGKSARYATAGLTIKNVKFDAAGISADACIRLGAGTNTTRYTNNVTVQDCTFTGTDNEKVAIKSYTGGDMNLTVTGCSATGMHSLAQLKNVIGVAVSDCDATGKNGISLGASSGVVISNCDMVLSGYGVRIDAIEALDDVSTTITDCDIEAFIPVVVRKATVDYGLVFSGENTMSATNTDGIWCAVGIEEYGDVTLDELTPASSNITFDIQDKDLAAGVNGAVATVNDICYFTLQDALDAAAAATGEVTVEILCDVDLTGTDWNPVTVSAPGYPCVTVNGNGHTISGLNDMLFAGTWAGKSGLIINDLTIADSDIQNDVNDTKGTVGVGAFIGYPQASSVITLNNCHLVDSKVSGGHWTGGLIGMAGGYNGNDGPVFMNLTINGCSVVGNIITGKGSVGGVIGHGSCAAWTNVVISDTVVRDNIIISTGDSNVKAGSIMGTIGAAGQPTTANGVTLTGGMSVEATVSGNSVTSNGTVITTIYGRQGSSTGLLEIVGGSYEHYPIEEDVAYANVKEGLRFFKGYDGYYGVVAVSATPEIIDGYWWIGDVNTGMVAEPTIEMKECAEHGRICWYVNGKCTNIQAVGTDGTVPEIAVVDGYWYIDNKDGKGLLPTGVKAEGADGITIVSVHKDAERSDALVSVYVITFSNGQEWRFSVTNGLNGDQGLPGIQGPEGPKGPTGDPGLPGADGNDNNQTVIIVISIATVCIIFTLAVVLYRGVGRRSWWCTR